MFSLSIIVMAHNRPNFLQVALDSIYRLEGVHDCKIEVYNDYASKEIIEEQRKVIDSFPSHLQLAIDDADSMPSIDFYVQEEKMNNLLSITYSINESFNRGAGKVLFLEDNVILRPDTLRYIKTLPRDSIFYNFLSNNNGKMRTFRSSANLVEKNNFSFLFEWIMDGKWIGKRLVLFDTVFNERLDGVTYDAVYSRFMMDYDFNTRYCDIPRAACFGESGYYSSEIKGIQKIYEKMFKGPPYCWLGQVVKVMEKKLYSKELEKVLMPKGFKWSDAV